jgi:mRNA interferase MazF
MVTQLLAQNDIVWADLGEPSGRSPVCVLSRNAAIPLLNAIVCAPITRTIRGIRSEVEVGPSAGLPVVGVINCDSILTVPMDRFDKRPVGHLSDVQRAKLDRALRYSLDIAF